MLSILIPTIDSRKEKFSSLMLELDYQISICKELHESLGEVKIIFDSSPPYLEGGVSIGEKRQALLNACETKYFCFLDDDERIAPNYIETLLRLCNENKDCCTFNSIYTNDDYWTIINMRLNNPNEEAKPGIIVKRNVWHVCPIKKELTNGIEFEKLNHNEDWTFIEKILPRIHTDAHTDSIIHNYNHSSKSSEADKIFKHEATTN